MVFEKMEKRKKTEGKRKYRHDFCNNCGKFRRVFAKGLCNTCYVKLRKGRFDTCVKCGKYKMHYAKGLCMSCYGNKIAKKRYEKDPEYRKKMAEYHKINYEKNKEKIKAYMREYSKKHPRKVISRNRRGLICSTCNSLIKTSGQGSRGKRKLKCPTCRVYECANVLDKCLYDRYTDRVVEVIKRSSC
jgi:hypothetical protein